MTTKIGAFLIRRAHERGSGDHGWLKTSHTFSFADWYEPTAMGFRSLRVFNDDFVAPSEGFGKHPHRDAEIFSYIVEGELTHRDSMNNKETLKPHDVQFTSAGSGIAHSEYNENKTKWCHFLQIWLMPHTRGLKPSYTTKTFPREKKINRFCPIVTADGKEDSIVVNTDANVFATILQPGAQVEAPAIAADRFGFLQVVKGKISLKADGDSPAVELVLGDSVQFKASQVSNLRISTVGDEEAEFLSFDMA